MLNAVVGLGEDVLDRQGQVPRDLPFRVPLHPGNNNAKTNAHQEARYKKCPPGSAGGRGR